MLLLLVVTLLCAVTLPCCGEVGLVTWLHPQEDGRLCVGSAYQGVQVQVRTEDGTEITDAAGLKALS